MVDGQASTSESTFSKEVKQLSGKREKQLVADRVLAKKEEATESKSDFIIFQG